MGQTTPGQTVPRQTTPRRMAIGQTKPGQTAPGQTVSGQTAPGQVGVFEFYVMTLVLGLQDCSFGLVCKTKGSGLWVFYWFGKQWWNNSWSPIDDLVLVLS